MTKLENIAFGSGRETYLLFHIDHGRGLVIEIDEEIETYFIITNTHK